jgi:hypothetical protein
MERFLARISGLLAVLLICSLPAFSQTLTSNITVRAEDSSAAVVPGVEVTISSPAMIGGSRKEITDETGSYRFTLLPPGTYRVSFALPGFKTLNIDDNSVTAGNTITVVGKMEVATTAEEVTVNSQAPTIDLEEATVGVNISQKMMDELPWSRSLYGASMMTPGVYSTGFDIGNSNFGTSSSIAARNGGRSGGNVVSVDGLVWCQSYMDYGSFEEMNVSTNAKGADQMNSGITLNTVVKSGGNMFHGNLSTKYQNGSMQSVNASADLVAQGFPVGSNKFTHFTDYYGDVGGPILKDKLWFYTAERWGYQGTYIPGFTNAVGGDPSVFYTELKSITAKLTYQLTPSQKLEAYMGLPDKFQPYRGGNALTPRDATQDQDSWSSQGPMLTYTNIIDPKTTVTAKITRGGYWWPSYTYGFNGDVAGKEPNVAQLINGQLVMAPLPTTTWTGIQNVGLHISDTTTSAVDGAYYSFYARPIRWQETVDFTRFTSIKQKNNEVKVGFMGWWDKDYTIYPGYPNYESYTYKSLPSETCPNSAICSNYFQHPYRVTVYNDPTKISLAGNGSGLYRALYFNDKITWNRKLTLNVGVRWDWNKSVLPAQGNTGEGPYSSAYVIKDSIDYYPNPDGSQAKFPVYSLLSPRLSFAYDVTGTGRIAIKGSYGRYVGITSGPGSQPGIGGADPLNSESCTFNWDGSMPFKPNFGAQNYLGSPTNVGLVGSCAKLQVVNGVTTPVASYHWDPNLKPSYVNEFTGTLDVGISKDYSFRVNIQRKFERNTYKTINLNVPVSAYTAARCVTDPGPDGILGTADDVPNGACFSAVPTSNPVLNAPASTYYAPNDESTHEGDNSFTAYVFTFNGKYANRLNFVGSYGIDMSHTNPLNPFTTVNGTVYGTYAPSATCPTPTGVTNPSGTSFKCEGPNAFAYNAAIAAAPTVWSQSLKMSGIYGLPDLLPFFSKYHLGGVQYSAQFISQNGAYYSRVINATDVNGTAQTFLLQNHLGRYPWLNNWDNEIRKKFKIGEGRQTVEFTWDLFNSMNANTIQGWSSTNVSSSNYLQPNHVTPLRPSSILAPRIYEWGVTYKF